MPRDAWKLLGPRCDSLRLVQTTPVLGRPTTVQTTTFTL